MEQERILVKTVTKKYEKDEEDDQDKNTSEEAEVEEVTSEDDNANNKDRNAKTEDTNDIPLNNNKNNIICKWRIYISGRHTVTMQGSFITTHTDEALKTQVLFIQPPLPIGWIHKPHAPHFLVIHPKIRNEVLQG